MSPECKLKLIWSQRIQASGVLREHGLQAVQGLYPGQVDWVLANGAREMEDILEEANNALKNQSHGSD